MSKKSNEFLKSIAEYKDKDLRKICYYLMYLNLYDTKKDLLKIQKPYNAVKNLSEIKYNIKKCWLSGFIDDDEFATFKSLIRQLQYAIAHHYVGYVLIFTFVKVKNRIVEWYNNVVNWIKERANKIASGFKVMFGK